MPKRHVSGVHKTHVVGRCFDELSPGDCTLHVSNRAEHGIARGTRRCEIQSDAAGSADTSRSVVAASCTRQLN